MQRRKFIAGVGSLAAGAAAVTGTGAFTSVNAQRTVSVNVVSDNNALLALKPNDDRVYKESGQLKIDFTTTGNNNSGNTGLNPDARTAFHDLFKVQNKGGDKVAVSVGVASNQVGIDQDLPGNSGQPANDAFTLLQDYPGINLVYSYAVTDSDGNQADSKTNGYLGNPPAVKLDDGGRPWLTSSGGRANLDVGNEIGVDLEIDTADSIPSGGFAESDVGIYVMAVDIGGERDITS